MAMCSASMAWNSSGLSHFKISVWLAVRPCLIALRDEASFPSAVFGPCDLAPLARAVSDFNSEGILLSPGLSVLPGSRMAIELGWYVIENNQNWIFVKL